MDDRRLGELAVRKGWIAPEELAGALQLVAALRRKGQVSDIGQVLVAEGRVSPEQLASLMPPAAAQILVCSNGACQRKFSIRAFNPAKTYLCKSCGSRLGFGPDEQATVHEEAGDSAADLPAIAPSPEMDASQATIAETFREGGRSGGQEVDETSTLGRFDHVVEIAHGGMGAIYRAMDPEIGRPVAIKVLRAGLQADDEQALRFLREARVTGQLQHPNIPPLYEVSRTPDGRLFFAMKLIEGKSLGESLDLVRAGRYEGDLLDVRRKLIKDLLKVCDALSYAHSRDVIHRDIKPANIMVGDFGEVLLMDWGIAKLRGDAAPEAGAGKRRVRRAVQTGAIHTLDGAILGTPAYMPPEQADGAVERIDERSDVYSMGAVLYEILTLEPPYTGRNVHAVLREIGAGNLLAPTRRAPDARVPAELDAVVMKAMAPDPHRRYRSVEHFRADLEAWLQNRTLAAARYTVLQRAAKWTRRHVALATGLAAVLVALVAGSLLAVSYEEVRAAGEARDLALRATGRVESGDLAGAQADFSKALALAHGDERTLELFAGAIATARGRAEDLDPREIDRESWYSAHSGVVALARELRRHRPDDAASIENIAWAALAMSARATHEGDFSFAMILLEDAGRGLPAAILDRERERIREAKEALGRQEQEKVATILERLGQTPPDRGLFDEEVLTIVKMPHPHVVRVLIPAVFAPEEWKRRVAIDALGKIGDGKTTAEVPLEVVPDEFPAGAGSTTRHQEALARRYATLRREWAPSGPADLDAVEALTLRLLATSLASEVDEAIEVAWALGRLRDGRARAALELKRESAGESRFFSNRTELPLEWLPRSAPIEGSEAEDLVAAAKRAMARGRLDPETRTRVLADLDQAIALDEALAEAWFLKGCFLGTARANVDEALRCFERAAKLQPSNTDYLARCALTRLAKGDPAGALVHIEAALRIDPQSIPALQARSAYHRIRKDQENYARDQQLVEAARAALAARPRTIVTAESLTLQGRLLLSKWELREAEVSFTRALEIDPDHLDAWLGRANARNWDGYFDGAIADASQAIRLEPRSPKAYLLRGNARRARGDYPAAVKDYRELVRQAERAMDTTEEDRLEFRETLSLGHAYLGQCRVALGEKEGLEDCAKGIEVWPENPEPYALRAMALVGLDRWDDAERDLIRAVERDGTWFSEEARKQILGLWSSGNYAALKFFLVQFQAKVPKDMVEQVDVLSRVIDRHLEKR